MSKSGKNILLNREGTEQNQRFIESLDPSSVRLNDFNLKEWMQFAYNFAKHVNYFSISNAEFPSGDWTSFFKNNEELDAFLSEVEEGGNVTPHLALFVCFVWLMEFPKKRFNQLTKRHLDFYYRDILKIEKLPATPDKVYVLFELAKKATQEKVPSGTELDAGKDGKGKKRIYETQDEIVVNRATVAQLRTVYNDPDNHKIKVAHIANSYDGEGADFPTEEKQWWPFGYYEKEKSETGKEKKYPELKDAKLGFAVASHVLEMKEGERNVQLSFQFSSTLSLIKVSELIYNIEIWVSGEKEWLGPYSPEQELKDENGVILYSTQHSGKVIKLAFQIPPNDGAVVGYNPKIHGENFDTTDPVCRILLKTENPAGYQLYAHVSKNEISELKIDVNVKGIKEIELENDVGILNADKPFYPFGTQPVKGSSFYINYPELFEKNWSKLNLNLKWKNTPDNFKDWYFAYRKDMIEMVTPLIYFKSVSFFTFDENNVNDDVEGGPLKNIVSKVVSTGDTTPANLIVTSNDYFKANIKIQHKKNWISPKPSDGNKPIFTKKDNEFEFDLTIENDDYETDDENPIKVSLNQSFLHEMYPRLYAIAMSSEDENVLIPNTPYTPFAESVTLDYSAFAQQEVADSKLIKKEDEIALFHELPFGQRRILTDNPLLLPEYKRGGNLYVGLKNAEPQQTVSLLIQLLEGSENPDSDKFDDTNKVVWSVLCMNGWQTLDSNFMIKNDTNNFLKSGVVKFIIPKDADKGSKEFGADGLIWISAHMNKKYDAVSNVIGVHAQAVKAVFKINEKNDLSHLQRGLEAGAIKGLVNRVSSVKNVAQPYSSYGGKPEESDSAFYRRISERLRHKKRAISIWDYEHLILEEFPNIYKVKCLNHTSDQSFLAPGYVYIIVIPDIVNTNVFDVFQPKVSKDTLNKIRIYVENISGSQVKSIVRNPIYEEVTVKLKVKFYPGKDPVYYLKKLNKDIIRLLSPWAYDKTFKINFSTSLHRSTLIHYLEKLEYIDYVEDVVLMKEGIVNVEVSPSNPKSILVSSREHEIAYSTSSCEKA